MQVVPVVPWSIARIIAGTLPGAGSRRATDVPELAGAVEEPRRRVPGDPVAEWQLDLLDPVARPDGIDRHPHLKPPAVSEGDQLAQRGHPHRPLTREGRLEAGAAVPLHCPAGIAER